MVHGDWRAIEGVHFFISLTHLINKQQSVSIGKVEPRYQQGYGMLVANLRCQRNITNVVTAKISDQILFLEKMLLRHVFLNIRLIYIVEYYME